MNEDLPYNFTPSSPVTDVAKQDIDTNNVSVLVEVLEDIKMLIEKHNTFDVLNPKSKLSVEEQIAAHMKFVQYLRQFETYIKNKVEELSDARR